MKTANAKQVRLVSLDALRGTIMLYMASHTFGLSKMAETGDPFWQRLAWWFDHVAWAGCSTWDLIQPAFMFMVGVALPYSWSRRIADGEAPRKIISHGVGRALILILIAVFLASGSGGWTRWEFFNVLGQIGLGYPFLFLLVNRGQKLQFGALAGILIGYWLLFALYPVAATPEDFARLGIGAEGLTGGVILEGFAAHWNKYTNVAAVFDGWFLNLFPRQTPFVFNSGGYTTLNFVPSLGTMILGLMSGELLRSERTTREKLRWLLVAGVGLTVIGLLAGVTICPLVKRIWTPSWTLFSGGLVVLLLAGYYWLIDLAGWRRWTYPLVVIGMNSIAIYMMSQLMRPWVGSRLRTHLGAGLFSGIHAPIINDCLVLLVFWLICWWMYRRRIFLRI
ncbi:MAG: acyltransferase family protein [Acidobacteriota bacterium]